MRTRETIEASQIEKVESAEKPNLNAEKYGRGEHPNSRANLIAPWTPETRPQSTGRPKRDMAQLIARQVFEQNPELIYNACVEQLRRGGAFAFQVYSDRAFGKLKEVRDTGSELNEAADPDLAERVAQLERDLFPTVYPSLAREAGEAARIGSIEGRAEKANGKAQDSDVLPGHGPAKTGTLP